MKNIFLFFLVFSLAPLLAHGQATVKISALPLGIGSGVNANDSFPYVDSVSGTTKRLKLSDIPNMPFGFGGVASVAGAAPIASSGGNNPTISCTTATASVAGCLAAADFASFAGKQAALSFGNLTSPTTGVTISAGGVGALVGTGASISIQTADATHQGLLTAADWNTFNSAAGGGITSLTGQATASGPGAAAVTLSNAAVIGKVLTGFTSGAGTVAATDSILAAINKLDGNTALKEPAITSGTTAQYWRGDKSFQNFNSAVGAFLSATAPILFNSGTGVFSCQSSSGTQPGCLSSSDWTTFNNKQSALTLGNLTSGTTGVTVTGGTGAVVGSGTSFTIQNATTAQPGLLTAADWNTFNGKQAALGYTPLDAAGSISMTANLNAAAHEIVGLATPSTNGSAATKLYVDTGLAAKQATGNYITALNGDVTAAGPGSSTAALASVITAGSCTNCNLTYDAKGRVTVAANGSASAVSSTTGYEPELFVLNGGVSPLDDIDGVRRAENAKTIQKIVACAKTNSTADSITIVANYGAALASNSTVTLAPAAVGYKCTSTSPALALSTNDLMNINVTSVAGSPEDLTVKLIF